MILTDKIYGTFSITDPAVVELVESPTFVRLKGIWQNGLPPRYLGKKIRSWTCTRYEHSVGVYLLLRKLGAGREEQIAGLLHDISHMAFSHAYDWIMEDYQKSDTHVQSQDKRHESYIKSTEIYGVLLKHKLDADKVIGHTKFPLLDRDLPELCADRIDYCLRELDADISKEIAGSLTVYKGDTIVFRNESLALKFARIFLDRNRNNWASYESASRFHILARTMRYAMGKGYISPSDFTGTDEEALRKIEPHKDDKYIMRNLEILLLPELPLDAKQTTAVIRFRYIDPLFWQNGKMMRVSEKYSEFAAEIENERKIFTAPISIFDGE
jgi:hypothetical protein